MPVDEELRRRRRGSAEDYDYHHDGDHDNGAPADHHRADDNDSHDDDHRDDDLDADHDVDADSPDHAEREQVLRERLAVEHPCPSQPDDRPPVEYLDDDSVRLRSYRRCYQFLDARGLLR
jgi:hypothetical protein